MLVSEASGWERQLTIKPLIPMVVEERRKRCENERKT